jgi:hypothetical protein
MLVPRVTPPLRIVLAVVLGVAAAVAWSVAPAPATISAGGPEPFTRTVEPADPENRPTAKPIISLTAACVREVEGGFEAVFGYRNRAPQSILVNLGPDTGREDDHDNVIIRMIEMPPIFTVDIEDLGPQVTLFKPGRHRHAFSVHFAPNETVAWRVLVPAADESGSWVVTVHPNVNARCGRDVPDHFAVVQDVVVAGPSAVNVEFDPEVPDRILDWDVELGVRSMRTACSHGGVPLAPKVVHGVPLETNLEPIAADYEVEIVRSGGTIVVAMSTESVRHPVDVFQDVTWLGPIADVTARCAFDNRVVESDEFWAELVGIGFVGPVLDENGFIIGFRADQNAPLGSRLR